LPEPIGIGGRGTSSCGSLGGLTCGGVKFFFCCATFPALPFFRSCCVMSSGAEAKVPGIMISALILSSSAALAQNTNYQGTTSKPGASFQKDDSTVAPHEREEEASLQAHEIQRSDDGFGEFIESHRGHH